MYFLPSCVFLWCQCKPGRLPTSHSGATSQSVTVPLIETVCLSVCRSTRVHFASRFVFSLCVARPSSVVFEVRCLTLDTDVRRPVTHLRRGPEGVRREQYLHVPINWCTITCKCRAFRSNKHVVTTREIEKVCLSSHDDKRWRRPRQLRHPLCGRPAGRGPPPLGPPPLGGPKAGGVNASPSPVVRRHFFCYVHANLTVCVLFVFDCLSFK